MAGSGRAVAMPTLSIAAATTDVVSEDELMSTQQFIENALDLKLKGNSTNYQYLIQQLAAPSAGATSSRRKIFLALPRCISAMANEPQAFQQLFDVLFKFTFLDDRADVDAFARFVVHLVSSNTVYVLPTLQMLARNLCRPQQLPAWLEPSSQVSTTVSTSVSASAARVSAGRIAIGTSFGGIVMGAAPNTGTTAGISVSTPPLDTETRIAERFARVHDLLARVLALVPTAANVLFPVLCEHVPHKRLAAPFQVAYVQNVLTVSTYVPMLQERVLALVVDQLVAVDVEIKLDETDDDDVFTMDDFLDDALLPPLDNPATQLDAMADKLDHMMLTTFAHIESLIQCKSESESTSESTTKPTVDVHRAATVFRHLLKVFEHSILNTHRSKYPQFLLFHICRVDPQFQDVLLSQLLATSLDPHVPPVTRHSCSAYLASFLARAKYIGVAYLQKALYHVLKWLHAQMDIYDALAAEAAGTTPTDPQDPQDGDTADENSRAALAAEQAALEAEHATQRARGSFYETIYVSSLQTACYVLCFRGLELAATPSGYEFLRSLGWQRVLQATNGSDTFCPLARCQPTVATEFLNLAETLDLVSPACIDALDQALSASGAIKSSGGGTTGSLGKPKSMERSKTPTAATLGPNSNSSNGQLLGQRQLLETFFPFDPYLLRRSFKYIGPSYIYWKHADPTSRENSAALAAVKTIIRDYEAAHGGHDDDDEDDDDEGDDHDGRDSSDDDDGSSSEPSDADDNDDDVSMAGSVPATPTSSFKGLSYLEVTMQQQQRALAASLGSSLDGGSLDDRDPSLLLPGGSGSANSTATRRKPSTTKRLSRSTFDPSPALSASSPPSRLPPLGSANAFTLGGFDDVEDDGF